MSSGAFNKVPLMIGYCNREGMLYDGALKAGLLKSDIRYSNKSKYLVPFSLEVEEGSELFEKIRQKIVDFYGIVENSEESNRDVRVARFRILFAKLHYNIISYIFDCMFYVVFFLHFLKICRYVNAEVAKFLFIYSAVFKAVVNQDGCL